LVYVTRHSTQLTHSGSSAGALGKVVPEVKEVSCSANNRNCTHTHTPLVD